MKDIARTIKKLKNGEHVTIVALGDSITELTFHTRGRMNWVGLLDEAIFESYGNGVCTLINSGKCASSYAETLTRLNRDVLRYNPNLVINTTANTTVTPTTAIVPISVCVTTLGCAGVPPPEPAVVSSGDGSPGNI